MRKWLALMCLSLVLSGCGDSLAPEPSIDGTWAGAVQGMLHVHSMSIALNEQSGVVTGSGSIINTATGEVRALSVSGTYAIPTVTLTLSSGSVDPMNFRATAADNAMTGQLSGSGFVGQTMTLGRQ